MEGIDMVKVHVESLDELQVKELKDWVGKEMQLRAVPAIDEQQCGQSNYTISTTEQAAPPYQPADGRSLVGRAGMQPQPSMGGATPAPGAASFASFGSAATPNNSTSAGFGQQQVTTQGSAPPAFTPVPTPQHNGTAASSTSAQPTPATTSTQTGYTQAQSSNGSGLAASKFAPQNSGLATSQPAGPSRSSTGSTVSTNNSASQTGTSGPSQVAGASSGGLGWQAGSGSPNSVNGTPGSGVSTFGAQSIGLVAGGQNIGQQGGQAGVPLASNLTGTGGFGIQTTAAGTASASGFGTAAANPLNPAPTPAPTPAPSVPNPASFSDNKWAGLTPASLDMLQKGIRPVLNNEAGVKLQEYTDQIAQGYVSEYLTTARRESEEIRTYMADSVTLKATLRDTSKICDRVHNLILLWTQLDEWGSKNTFARDFRFEDDWVEEHGILNMLDECIELACAINDAAKRFNLVNRYKSVRNLKEKATELRGGETRMLVKWPLANAHAGNAQESSASVQSASYTNDSFPSPGSSNTAQVNVSVPDAAVLPSGSGVSSSLPIPTSSTPANTEATPPAVSSTPDLNKHLAAALHKLPIDVAQYHFDTYFAITAVEIEQIRAKMTPEKKFEGVFRSNKFVSNRLKRMKTAFHELDKWANLGDPRGGINDSNYKPDDYHRKTRLEDWWTDARQISELLNKCLALGQDIFHIAMTKHWDEPGLQWVDRWLKQMNVLRDNIPMVPYEELLTSERRGAKV
ncbi:hypothetical protein LTR95_006830 [Oleoguttula sp. CCFEE 5521]